MKKEDLAILLEKYYEGTSTPKEEEILRNYFRSPGVMEGFEAEKAIFGYFANSEAIPEPSPGFEPGIIERINVLQKRRIRRILYSVSAIAASFILIISLVFFIKSKAQPQDTFNDPRIAYAETMKILYNISVQLNKGTEALEPVSKINDIDLHGLSVFNQSMKTLDTEMNNLQPLNDAIELTDKRKNEK